MQQLQMSKAVKLDCNSCHQISLPTALFCKVAEFCQLMSSLLLQGTPWRVLLVVLVHSFIRPAAFILISLATSFSPSAGAVSTLRRKLCTKAQCFPACRI